MPAGEPGAIVPDDLNDLTVTWGYIFGSPATSSPTWSANAAGEQPAPGPHRPKRDTPCRVDRVLATGTNARQSGRPLGEPARIDPDAIPGGIRRVHRGCSRPVSPGPRPTSNSENGALTPYRQPNILDAASPGCRRDRRGQHLQAPEVGCGGRMTSMSCRARSLGPAILYRQWRAKISRRHSITSRSLHHRPRPRKRSLNSGVPDRREQGECCSARTAPRRLPVDRS